MTQRQSRSLKYEYQDYLEREIETYKDSVSRKVLLSIADDAVAVIAAKEQVELGEMTLCIEVDKIIFRRLRLPSFATWHKRRVKLLKELRRPEHWGLSRDDLVVRAVQSVVGDSRVLLACAQVESPALYLAANGCDVTALAAPGDVQRVLDAAQEAGLGDYVHASALALDCFTPHAPLSAVIYTPAAFKGLSAAERTRVIEVLQSATADGGVHLVRTIVAGKRTPVSLEELRRRYRGWEVTVNEGESNSFLARKGIS